MPILEQSEPRQDWGRGMTEEGNKYLGREDIEKFSEGNAI